MKIAVITIAGISSRFNEGIDEDKKVLKCIYTESIPTDTLLYQLLSKCIYADKIILVGGYKFEELCAYYVAHFRERFGNVKLVKNGHFEDFGSGYSLYLGLEEAFKYNPGEILFMEGDLDIDNESFQKVLENKRSVLTYNFRPIYADKAVVLYKDDKGCYRYAFSSSHRLLTINSSFSCILNSGQTWKFTEVAKLQQANKQFYDTAKADTNLCIIQNYLDSGVDVDIIPLDRWTNCNTREDYKKIVTYWKDER